MDENEQKIPKLKYLQPLQYKSWLRKANDPEWDEERFGCSTRSKPERAAAAMALELRDAFAAMAEKDRELSDTRAALAAVRAQLEADPQVLEFARKTIEELGSTVKRLRQALETVKKIPVQYVNEGDDPYYKEDVADTCGELEERIRVIADAALTDPAPKKSTEGEQS